MTLAIPRVSEQQLNSMQKQNRDATRYFSSRIYV